MILPRHPYRYLPGEGLYGPLPRAGELCTALRPDPASVGDWIVRWARDGVQGRACVLDLRTVETLTLPFMERH